MSTSNLKPIVSEDGSSFWFICPENSVDTYFYNQVFTANVPILIGTTNKDAIVSVIYPDSSSTVIDFTYDGQVVETTPTSNTSMISVYAPYGATVAITPRPDAQPSVSGVNTVNGAYLTRITSTTAISSTGLTGSAHVLCVGAGGGGGGGSTNTGTNTATNMGGGGGGTGALSIGYVNSIQNLTATIGAAGTGGSGATSATTATPAIATSGNAGGTTSIGNISAPGGGGGISAYSIGNAITVNNSSGIGGTAGSATGTSGGSGEQRHENAIPRARESGSRTPLIQNSPIYSSYSTASGNGGPGGVHFGYNTAISGISGNIGSSGGYNTAPYTANAGTMTINAGSGYGYGGAGGIGVRIYSGGGGTGASQHSAGQNGGNGVVYIFKVPS